MYCTVNVTSVLLQTAKKYKLYADNFLYKSALIKIWFEVNETFLCWILRRIQSPTDVNFIDKRLFYDNGTLHAEKQRISRKLEINLMTTGDRRRDKIANEPGQTEKGSEDVETMECKYSSTAARFVFTRLIRVFRLCNNFPRNTYIKENLRLWTWGW